MARIIFNGESGDGWQNDTGKVKYQLIVNWQNSCGVCAAYDHAISDSWPLPFHRNCLLPGTEIIAPGLMAGVAARYSGPIYRITFDDGVTVAVTAKHMLLTTSGFAFASGLVEGDQVIRYPLAERESLVDPDDHWKPTRVEEVVEALAVTRGMVSESVPVAAIDLHGDGRSCEGEIDVVTSNGLLPDDSDPSAFQRLRKHLFGGAGLAASGLASQGDLPSLLVAMRDATDGVMGGLRERKAFLWGRLAHAEECGFGPPPNGHTLGQEYRADHLAARSEVFRDRQFTLACPIHGYGYGLVDRGRSVAESLDFAVRSHRDAGFLEAEFDDVRGDAQRLRDASNGLPGLVATCNIIRVEKVHYSGLVYDIETTSSLYVFGNGVTSSNCRCKQVAIYPGKASLPFVDFREEIRRLDPAQQSRVVGKSNLILIERGVVEWSDVVSRGRIRDLNQVVAAKALTVPQMAKAGVKPAVARRAHESVHTPLHDLEAAKRKGLVEALRQKGLTDEQIKKALGERLAARLRIGRGPSGPGAMPPAGPPPVPPARPPAKARKAKVDPPLPVAARADYLEKAKVDPAAARDLALREEIGRELGVKFRVTPKHAHIDETVVVDVARLDAVLAEDVGYHVGPGGVGPSVKPGAYANAAAFVARARESGEPVDQPRLVLDREGRPSIEDGRHRWAVLRDMGARLLPVSVARRVAKAFRKLFGID